MKLRLVIDTALHLMIFEKLCVCVLDDKSENLKCAFGM